MGDLFYLRQCIRSLKEANQLVLGLWLYLEDLPYAEIADITNLSEIREKTDSFKKKIRWRDRGKRLPLYLPGCFLAEAFFTMKLYSLKLAAFLLLFFLLLKPSSCFT